MNYNYDYSGYTPNMNPKDNYSGMYNKMSYKGKKAVMTLMDENTPNYGTNNMNYQDPNDMMAFMNNMNNMNYNQQLVDPYLGLVRGNLFNNLYDPYKNYKPQEIDVNNERASLLGQIQMYNFAIVDLNLYLDVKPNDKNALQLLKNYAKAKEELCKQYTMKYGPLEVSETTANTFNWIDSPWPWEEVK